MLATNGSTDGITNAGATFGRGQGAMTSGNVISTPAAAATTLFDGFLVAAHHRCIAGETTTKACITCASLVSRGYFTVLDPPETRARIDNRKVRPLHALATSAPDLLNRCGLTDWGSE